MRYWEDRSRILDDGSIGFFWRCYGSEPADLDDDSCERGHILRRGGVITVETLIEDVGDEWMIDPPPGPDVVAAVLSTGGGLLFQVFRSGGTTRIGTAASSLTVRGRSFIGGVALDDLASNWPLELEAHFHGVAAWTGHMSLSEDFELDDDGHLNAVVLRMGPHSEESVSLGDGRVVSLASDWDIEGPADRRTATARLSVRCSSEQPRPFWELLTPVLAVQDLLSVVHNEPISAATGSARMQYRDDGEHRGGSSWLWSAPLMQTHPALETAEFAPLALIRLDQLGGVGAIGRWVHLCEKHARATRPVTGMFRDGPQSASVALRELAAGIEYWVKANRPAAWAAGKKYAQVLGQRVGPAFEEWVGDAERWGQVFWQANNGLKHQPGYERPVFVLRDLAASAHWLLTAGLLNDVAQSTAPAQRIFGRGTLNQLGERVRNIVLRDDL